MVTPDRSDDAVCEVCGKAINLTACPPCPHGIAVCAECEPADVCDGCLEALVEEVEAAAGSEPPC